MKNVKLKILSLGILSTIIISSTPVFAATNTNNSNKITNPTIQSTNITPSQNAIVKPKENFNYGVDGGPGLFDLIDSGGIVQTGDVGLAVEQLQFFLKWQGYKISIDGKFGSNTNDALKSFQKKNSLKVDGIAGKSTEDEFFKLADSSITLYWDSKSHHATMIDGYSRSYSADW